ncbi:MAG: TonB-dependent receptor [Pseudomonadota bacterium]|nr:TonB-dependent receptor [Pseudomonadota bacterium]
MLTLVSLLSTVALAAPPVDPFTEPDDADLYRLDEKIVTVAARYAQTVRDAPAIVTVLTDRELRERGFRTLSDALRSLPGVYVTSTKESRKLAWFRGVISADDNKILLLVDGVPWYDGVYTHAWIDEYLPLENVRQIEIIKGPGSTIYGTNAFSGVINVVTYTAAELSGGFVRVLGGTAARRGVSAVVGQPFEVGTAQGGITAYARYYEADGDGLDISPRGNANVSGDDPKRAINAGVKLTLGDFSLRWDGVDYRHTYYTNDQDDPFDVLLMGEQDFWLQYHDQQAAASYALKLGPSVTITPRVAWRRHDDPGQYAFFGSPVTTAVTDDAGATTYTTGWDTTLVETFKLTQAATFGVDLEARPVPAHVIVGGVGGEALFVERIADVYYEDLSHDGIEGRYEADPATLWGLWAYAQDTWTALPFLEITAGARVDYHGTYGAFPSPRAGILLLPSDAVSLKVLYGRAFRAPTAREWLVHVSSDEEGKNDFTAGNPDLLPESINTVETELSVSPSRDVKLRAAGFYSSITGEINKVTVETPGPLGDDYYDNSGGSDIFGGEAEATVTLGAFDLDGSYSYTWATDRDTGYQQYEFPAHMAHARVGWRLLDAIRASLLLDVIGPRTRASWSPDAGAQDAPAYALLGAGLATDALGGRVRVDLAAYNLLDTQYSTWLYRDDANETSNGEPKYPVDPAGEGRTIQVGVEVAF